MNSYIEIFEKEAQLYPDKTAIVDMDSTRRISYEKLENLSRRVASKLLKINLSEGTPVLIYMDRCYEYVAAYLGIQMAGCAAVPLVFDYPKERIEYIKKDCQAGFTITKDFFSDLDLYLPTKIIEVNKKTPAHITYTSGSTGKPKGILHTVASIFRAASGPCDLYDIGEDIIYAAASTFSFFICVYDILRPLSLGAEVHIISDSVRKNPAELSKYYLENHINLGFLSPQLLKNFKISSPFLRRILAGGEQLSNFYSDSFQTVNVYGTSETGLVCSFFVDRKYPNTPIGKPFSDCSFIINSENSDNKDGELCVLGDFSKEYINLSEESKKTFEIKPDGKVLYHTGDFVYRDDKGNYIYQNRLDWMVKVNGQRVETLEVENVLKSFDCISNAAVRAFLDKDLQTYLCGYYVSLENSSEERVRKLLKEKLPEYMIPRFLIKMDSLPLSINGKLDRMSLLPPMAEEFKTDFIPPSNELEASICDGFSEVLTCGRVGIEDDFFSLGGDSIKTLKLISFLEEKGFGRLRPEDILLSKTPALISACFALDEIKQPISSQNLITPLSESQRGVYFECLEAPNSTMYNIPFALKLPKGIDLNRFLKAVETAALCHPALFVTIGIKENEPVMYAGEPDCKIDLSKAKTLDEAKKDFVRPFDLKKGPLYRFELFDTKEGALFLMDIHHLIFDGSSLSILLRQIADAYEGRELSKEKISLFDISESEKNLKETPLYHEAQEYFQSRFKDEDFDAELLPDIDKTKVKPNAGIFSLSLEDPSFIKNIGQLSRKNRVTENILFAAAFSYALTLFNGTKDACFSTASNGRHLAGLSDTVGMFVKTLPLRFNIPESGDLCEFLNEVLEVFYKSFKYDCISFGELAEKYSVHTNISYVYQSELLSEITLAGEVLMPEELPTGEIQSDLICMVLKKKSGFELRMHYRKELYSKGLVESLSETVFTILKGMIKCNNLHDITLTSKKCRDFVDSFNHTEMPYDESRTVSSLLKETIEAYPENTALVYLEKSYTYRQLGSITSGLAAFIFEKGIRAEDFVAVLTPRNDEGVLAAWGIVRSGAAFQMLDPTYPPERLNYMLKDSKARLLIADRKLIGLVSEYQGDILYTDEIIGLSGNEDFYAPSNPGDAFTLIYTSGTTGKPKGCVLENKNLISLYKSHSLAWELSPDSRVASYASFGFDAGIKDFITTILSGASLYIIPDEIRLDIKKVDEFFCKNKITHATFTTQVGRAFAEETTCESLKFLSVGGEKLVPFMPKGTYQFVNEYGPSEAACYISRHVVTDNGLIQPIGKPTKNAKLYVMDKFKRLMPVGALGELAISGHQVGRGYLGLAEKTNEVFVKNPFTDEKGYERIYKTGDIVRLLCDGNLEFVGRKDSQVKIRGFRIELTEVEEVIRRFKGIKDATVAAFDDPSGGKFIAAYVVSDEEIDIQALNDFILSEKPSYMLPQVTMQIEAIPYTQNHKVNKRALCKPKKASPKGEILPPENENQKKILDILTDILGTDKIGINTDLFDAGLTSISTLKFNLALGKAFKKSISISDIKEKRNILLIEKLLSDKSDKKIYDKQSDYPIMKNQMGVFLDSISDKNTLRYNIPSLFKLSEKIDIKKLKTAVEKAIDAHPYIKSTLFETKEGEVFLKRNDELKAEIEIITLKELPGALSLIRPFEIIGKKLYRAEIYATNSGNYLFLDVHHILSDGTSLGILLDEINRCFCGENPRGENFTGFDASLREEEVSKSENYINSQKYFDHLLSGLNTDCLPAPCPERKEDEIKSAHFLLELTDYSAKIIAYCNKNGFTLNAFFNAVFSHTLSLYLHSDDITYCTVYNGRGNSDFADSFAMLVKTLPVRTFVDYKTEISSFISDMQKQLLESMSNDFVPFSELSRKYSIKPDIFFNYQGDNFIFDNIGGEKAEILTPSLPDVKAPLSIEVFLKEGIFSLDINYSTSVFCKEFASSLADSILCAAGGFTKYNKLSEVSIISEREMAYFDQMNSTDRPFEKVPAHFLIDKYALKNPDKTAVISKAGSFTFKELIEKSNALANALISLGTKRNEIVGLILDRNEFIPVGEIGIMKSGSAFLPMLPTYPDDRLDFCMTDAKVRFVISSKDIIEKRPELFSKDKPYKALAIEDLCEFENKDLPSVTYDMSDLVYCIYTSGSTGTPKGVMLEHHNLSNFVQTSSFYDIEAKGSTLLAISSISFDMSLTEIFFSLCSGNRVYIAAEEEIHNLDLLLLAFTKNNIDMMIMTPSLAWSLLSLKDFEKALANLEGLVLGAEAFQPALYKKLKALNPKMLIQNGYGPTECTQACSAKNLTLDSEITIGGPFANTKFYVMDDNKNLLPRYAVGELIISGECVCRGYVNQPEKNKASFLEIKGIRSYHSGDLIRINRDNEAQFGGRKDNQVKLRGFRIELDEVEAVMNSFDKITSSKVIVRNNGTEDFLAAFFTADKEIDIDELTAFMKSKLTYYMIPAAMMQIDKMPLTPSGKIDKKSLPEIKAVKKERKIKKPKKSLEEKILEVFKSVLSNDDCYVDDNFFEIGGTSLSASKAVMQIKADGYKIEYQDIFDHQSAEELAKYLESLTINSNIKDKNEERRDEEEFSDVLKFNTIEYAKEVERKSLGTVVLTGPTGFLGCHILKELIDNEDGKIICLSRKGSYDDVIMRLKASLVYYFEDDFEEAFSSRISVIEGDITDEKLSEKFKDIPFDTLINCAASVKHYANDNSIEFVNVFGVENLIALTKEKAANMIQISTTSVPGTHTDETYKQNLKMPENRLFVIEDNNNQYIQSKYKAEKKMFEAIRAGMKGKVIRVGNLMGRYSDGEFQANNRTNAFINGLRGFINIGKCPISHSTDPMGFSPIDCTARAVVLLAGTNDKFTAFHADSRYTFDEMKLIEAVNNCGLKVTPVKDEEYYSDFYRMMADPQMNEKVSALLTNDRPDLHSVETDNRFTANVLYRLGFSWPFIDTAYLERVIKSLDSLDFFFMER